MACSSGNHSASMSQETLFELYSPVLKNMSVCTDTALYDNILPRRVCSCLGRRPGLLSRDLLHPSPGRQGGKHQQQQLARHRLFPRGVQVLAAEFMGCPAFAHAEGGGQSSQQGHPPAKHSTHLKGAWAQRGLREFLSSVWFVESVVCSGSHALQGLAQPHLEPASALAHTASTDERFPRSPSTVQGTAPGACSEPGYGQLQLMVSNSCFGRDSE